MRQQVEQKIAKEGRVDLTLPNSRPTITAATARLTNKGVRRAPLGASVDAQVQTIDPDGDTLHYRWGVQDGNGTVVSADATSVSWHLPNAAGTNVVYVVANDGKGGYAFDRIPLTVGATGVGFSGQVTDAVTHSPINGARVTVVNSVDKVQVLTDAQGHFQLGVKEDPNDRYVMNIHNPGYAFLSRVFDSGTYGGRYELTRAFQQSCDPNTKITLIDRSPDLEKQQRRGAVIVLEAGTLVDKNGNPAPSPLTCSISTLDPSLLPLPGDYRAKDRNGKDQSLVSYGAVFAEFSDAAGNLYNLKSGATASLTTAVPGGLQPVAPGAVPVWSYDETTGFWKEETLGKAILQNVAGVPSYVFKTSHFSYLNTDVAKTGQPTCLRIKLDPNGHLAAGITVRVRIPTAPAYQQVQELVTDNDEFHAIFRLPWSNPPAVPHNTVILEPLDAQHQPIPGASQTIDLDARPQMDLSHTLWPPYPYAECGDPVLIGIQVPNFAVDSHGVPLYLTGIGSSIPDPTTVDPVAMTNAYYDAIDPNHNRTKLGDWWNQNGFDPNTGAGGTRASYLNNNDLGFGRDMHCIQNGGNVACYVTNYGDSDQNPGNADLALTANTAAPPGPGGGPIATVAMEYAPVEGQGSTKIVKFFVFQGGAKAGTRLLAADLDHNGAKPVPQLCAVCHGGVYNPVDYNHPTFAEVNMGSSFREFDLLSFKYPGNRDFGGLNAGELSAFHALNNIVNQSSPSPAITEVINGWYLGGTDHPDTSFAPASWNGVPQRPLYINVVANSCRTCHVAKPGGRTDIMFNTYDSFFNNKPLIQPRVCGVNKVMPNAKVTYNNFWTSTSPSRPATLAGYNDPAHWTPAFGACN